MSMTLSKLIRQNTVGQRRQTIGTFTGPASYATNGDVNTVANLTGGRIKEADSIRCSDSYSATYRVSVVYGSDGGVNTIKFKIFVVATGAEVANAVDLSAQKFRVEVQGN